MIVAQLMFYRICEDKDSALYDNRNHDNFEKFSGTFLIYFNQKKR